MIQTSVINLFNAPPGGPKIIFILYRRRLTRLLIMKNMIYEISIWRPQNDLRILHRIHSLTHSNLLPLFASMAANSWVREERESFCTSERVERDSS